MSIIEIEQLTLGETLKLAGQQKVEEHNQRWITEARLIAVTIARELGEVTIDDVRQRMDREPLHPNAYGATFKVGFEFTGRFVKSALASNHGRIIRVWRLKE